MTSQLSAKHSEPLRVCGADEDLVGFLVAVRRGNQVVVLDLLEHPCAQHILHDIEGTGESGSIAELVAGINGAELVAGTTSANRVQPSSEAGPRHR